MARETTTVQCYPSDSAVNRKIREYETFGWELIGNQRCEESGGTFGGYRQVSTFNKLTFSRDKSAPWYTEVVELESRYEMLMNTEPTEKKPSKILCLAGILFLFSGFGLFMTTLSIGFKVMMGLPAIVLFAIGIMFFVLYRVKKSRCKMNYIDCHSKWVKTSGQEMTAILERADTLING